MIPRTKNTEFIAVPKISSKTGSDKTNKELNSIASLQQLTALLTALVLSGLLFCDPKTNS